MALRLRDNPRTFLVWLRCMDFEYLSYFQHREWYLYGDVRAKWVIFLRELPSRLSHSPVPSPDGEEAE